MVRLMLFFRSFQMFLSTLANLVENSNNLLLAVGGEHWTFSAYEDKYSGLVEGCRAKRYAAKTISESICFHIAYMSLGIIQENNW